MTIPLYTVRTIINTIKCLAFLIDPATGLNSLLRCPFGKGRDSPKPLSPLFGHINSVSDTKAHPAEGSITDTVKVQCVQHLLLLCESSTLTSFHKTMKRKDFCAALSNFAFKQSGRGKESPPHSITCELWALSLQSFSAVGTISNILLLSSHYGLVTLIVILNSSSCSTHCILYLCC